MAGFGNPVAFVTAQHLWGKFSDNYLYSIASSISPSYIFFYIPILAFMLYLTYKNSVPYGSLVCCAISTLHSLGITRQYQPLCTFGVSSFSCTRNLPTNNKTTLADWSYIHLRNRTAHEYFASVQYNLHWITNRRPSRRLMYNENSMSYLIDTTSSFVYFCR